MILKPPTQSLTMCLC